MEMPNREIFRSLAIIEDIDHSTAENGVQEAFSVLDNNNHDKNDSSTELRKEGAVSL